MAGSLSERPLASPQMRYRALLIVRADTLGAARLGEIHAIIETAASGATIAT